LSSRDHARRWAALLTTAPLLLLPQLLTALRKLDCYKLQVQDLQASGIGAAVATLASCHPKPEVAALATSLLQKWRDLVETQLFQPLAYDAQAAGAAPEGDAECPEDLMAAEREAARLERLERRRLRLEQDFMASSSEDEIATASEEEDPDWAPQVGAKGGGRRSKSARVAEAAAAGGGGGATRGVLAVEVVTLPDAPADPPEPQQPSKFKNMHPFFRNLHASAMKE
jgi:hypothetical protein